MSRKEFTMTDEQQAALLDACQPVPYMVIGGVPPRSPQENANAAWKALGNELGFVWDTVQPVPGSPDKHFTAERRVRGAETTPDNGEMTMTETTTSDNAQARKKRDDGWKQVGDDLRTLATPGALWNGDGKMASFDMGIGSKAALVASTLGVDLGSIGVRTLYDKVERLMDDGEWSHEVQRAALIALASSYHLLTIAEHVKAKSGPRVHKLTKKEAENVEAIRASMGDDKAGEFAAMLLTAKAK